MKHEFYLIRRIERIIILTYFTSLPNNWMQYEIKINEYLHDIGHLIMYQTNDKPIE